MLNRFYGILSLMIFIQYYQNTRHIFLSWKFQLLTTIFALCRGLCCSDLQVGEGQWGRSVPCRLPQGLGRVLFARILISAKLISV